METKTVDGNDDFGILVDDKTGQTLGWSLNLTSKERASIVGQRPAKLEIFSNKPLGRGIAGYSLQTKFILEL